MTKEVSPLNLYKRFVAQLLRENTVLQAEALARARVRRELGVTRLASGLLPGLQERIKLVSEIFDKHNIRSEARRKAPRRDLELRLYDRTRASVIAAAQVAYNCGQMRYDAMMLDYAGCSGDISYGLATLDVWVPRTWLRQVYNQGIAVVEGDLVLEATPMLARKDTKSVQVWRAKWIEWTNDRPNRPDVVEGYIVRRQGKTAKAVSWVTAGKRLTARERIGFNFSLQPRLLQLAGV